MAEIVALIDKDLSEPYSIFTYSKTHPDTVVKNTHTCTQPNSIFIGILSPILLPGSG